MKFAIKFGSSRNCSRPPPLTKCCCGIVRTSSCHRLVSILLWMWIAFLLVRVSHESTSTCFDVKQIEHVRSIRKQSFELGGSSMPKTLHIDVSRQTGYARVAEVLAIVLREFYRYPIVKIHKASSSAINTTQILDRLSQKNCESNVNSANSSSIYCPMVSLTAPIPAGFNLERWTLLKLVADGGPLGPNARSGWFIDNRWIVHVWDSKNIILDSWRAWTSPTYREKYFLTYGKWKAESALSSAFDASKVLGVAVDAMGTRVVRAVDNLCTQTDCELCLVVMVAEDVELAEQAVRQMDALNISVCAIVAHNTSQVQNVFNALNGKLLPSPLLFGWSPSALASRLPLKRISLENCLDNFRGGSSSSDSSGGGKTLLCDYPINQLIKLTKYDLMQSQPDVWELIKRLVVSQKDFSDLLTEEGANDTEAACRWMKKGWATFSGRVELCSDVHIAAKTQLDCPWCCWLKWTELRSKMPIFIGVLYPSGTRWVDATLQMSARFAQQRINMDNSILKNFELRLVEFNVTCQRDTALYNYINMVHKCQETLNKSCPILGIIGSICSEALKPVVEVSRHYFTTIISPTVEADELSDADKFPFFFRTVPSMRFYSKAVRQFVQNYGWNRIGILTQHEMFLRRATFEKPEKVAKNAVHATSVDLCAYKILPDQELSVEKALVTLKKAKDANCRIFASDHFVSGTCRLMCAATKLEMQPEHGYVWILSPWLQTNWNVMNREAGDSDNDNNCYSTLTAEDRKNCPEAQFQRTTQGYFVLRTERTVTGLNSSTKRAVPTVGNVSQVDLQEHIRKLNKAQEPQDSQYFFYYIYDAVWTFARAIDELLTEDITALNNPNRNSTKQHETALKLKHILEKSSFEGLSGHVSFSKHHNRQEGVFKVLQYVDMEMKKRRMRDRQKESLAKLFLNVDKMKLSNTSATMDHKSNNRREHAVDYTIADIKWKMNRNEVLHEDSLQLQNTADKTIVWFTKDGKKPTDGKLHIGDECPSLKPILLAFNMEHCNQVNYLLIAVGTVLFIFVFVGASACYFRRKSQQLAVQLLMEEPFRLVQAELQTKEILRDDVLISRKLGEGNFGTVYGGEAKIKNKWESCAIKTLTLSSISSTEEKLYFLHEARTMRSFEHPNVVHLLGVCTEADPFYIIVELCMFGDLKSFLLTRRHTALNSPHEPSICAEALTRYCKDIVCGLDYIHSQKLVHRDLALRNCLVHQLVKGDMVIVKVGDFGFARSVTDKNYYRFERKAEMPLRWMPPESIQFGYFTFETDVWAFGVVLYEIVTFGGFPYGDLSTSQVMDHLKYCRGGSVPLALPRQATEDLNKLISWCHQYEGRERPTTLQLKDFFSNHPSCVTACLEDCPPDPGEEIIGISRFPPGGGRAGGAKTPGSDERGRHKSGDRNGPLGSILGDSITRLNQTSINSSNRASSSSGRHWFTGKSDGKTQNFYNSCEQIPMTQHSTNHFHQHHHSGGSGGAGGRLFNSARHPYMQDHRIYANDMSNHEPEMSTLSVPHLSDDDVFSPTLRDTTLGTRYTDRSEGVDANNIAHNGQLIDHNLVNMIGDEQMQLLTRV